MKSDVPVPRSRLNFDQSSQTSPDKLRLITSSARSRQLQWQSLPLIQRAAKCREFANLIYLHKDDFIELIKRENGKPEVEIYSSEIIPSIDLVRYAARKSSAVFRPRRVKVGLPLLKTKRAFVRYEPFGVVGIISAWNYPLLLPVGQIVPALIAGNSVVFKPSEHTPLVGALVVQLLRESGIPDGILNLVQGGGDVGAALVSSGVDKIFFTGSSETGRKISAAAAQSLTPVSLELGSKDAMIVLEDADLEATTSGAIWGAFMNAGQTCVSVERCYVHEKVFDEFVETLRKKMKRLRVGNGLSDQFDIGAIIHEGQYKIIQRQIEDAVSHGAKVLEGGEFSKSDGAFYVSPTLLVDVPDNALVLSDETFGPVLPVIKVHSDEHAIELANSSRYGLAASVWTSDRSRGLKICERLKAGAVVLNDVISYYGMSDGVVGGVKESGSGRVHGEEGLREMVNAKYYEIERLPGFKRLWWYNYDIHTLSFFENAADYLYSKNILKKFRAIRKMFMNFLRMKKI